MTNDDLAATFLEIADLLDLDGERFKPEAYRRAARALEQLGEDAATLVKEGRIQEVRGIGEALAKKIMEYVTTGKVGYLEKLRAQHPPGLLALMRLPGVGPKTTARFHVEFGIDSIEALKSAIDSGQLEGAKGFGAQRIKLFRAAVDSGGSSARTPLPLAQREADALVEALRTSGAPIDQIQFAGSLRRRRETVGDLDLVATSSEPAKVMETFVHLPGVREVRLRGETKTTIVRDSGIQVDLRVVAPQAFGAAMQYLTGSKDHNVRVRTIALQRGLRINEYGVTQEGKLISTPTEEEVYRYAGLQYIPPEIRENSGEIELAASGKLPVLLSPSDVKGELHIHLGPEATIGELETWARGLRAQGLLYGGFVLGPKGINEEIIRGFRQRVPPQRSGVRLLVGVEVPWPDSGKVADPPEGADYLILRAPESWAPNTQAVRSREGSRGFVAHLEALPPAARESLLKSLAAAKGPSVEVGVMDTGTTLESSSIHRFTEAGGSILVSSVPRSPEDLGRISLASGLATRGWVKNRSVGNAREDPFPAGRTAPS